MAAARLCRGHEHDLFDNQPVRRRSIVQYSFCRERVSRLTDPLLFARKPGGIIVQLELEVYDRKDVLF
jgi:hypothetical protein